jgi:hypothetical protein
MFIRLSSIFLCSLVCALVLWYTLPNGIHNDTKVSRNLLFVNGDPRNERQQGDSEWIDPSWTIHRLPSGRRILQERMNQSLQIHENVQNLSSPIRIIQDMNASVDVVWEQIHHYLTTATWNRSVPYFFMMEWFLQYNETVNVTLPSKMNSTLEHSDPRSWRKRPRRSKLATDEIQQQKQNLLEIRVNVKFLPFLFTERSYHFHYTLVPEQNVVFWKWTLGTPLLLLGRGDTVADANSVVRFGSGYSFLLQQASNPPMTRLFHSMSIEWNNLLPAAVSGILEFAPPVESKLREWLARFILAQVIRHVKEQSETLQGVAMTTIEDDFSKKRCSSTHASSHQRIPPLLRQWWRNIRRLLPSEGDRDDHFLSEEGSCEVQPANFSSLFNETEVSAPIPGVRPIGVTRYLLVCSVLSLTLLNIYLFFS